MARLGWGKKKITEGCISDWYKDHPIGRMAKDMRDNHRLLAQEYGGGKYRDSVLVYETTKFLKALNIPENTRFSHLNNHTGELTDKYVELAVAVPIWEKYHNNNQPGTQETFL